MAKTFSRFAYRPFQVPVRGGDHADVDVDGLVPADALERPLLKHAQQLGLGPERHVADLIEEHRPPIGLLEPANPPRARPGERSLLVAEEFAFKESLRDGDAVHHDHGLAGALAVLVDGARDELLARPGLAMDEDRGVRLGHATYGLVDPLHRLAPADHRVAAGLRRVGGERHRSLHEARALEGVRKAP
jgi:hypothetical protein